MEQSSLILAYPDGGEHIRTIYQKEEILFCLADIVKLLAARNTQIAKDGEKSGLTGLTKAIIHSLEDDERAFIRDDSQKDPVQYVTQPGLFRIILADKSPACKKFQRWVLHDVLPSIQKYGTYPPPLKEDSNELKRAVELLLGEINERERLEQETNRRFIENEKKLQELDSKISEAGYPTSPRGYLSVESYCLKQTPPITDQSTQQKIFGWCIKICAEEFHSSYKDGNGTLYPEEVLKKASDNATGSQ